jgi:hypothetical protein
MIRVRIDAGDIADLLDEKAKTNARSRPVERRVAHRRGQYKIAYFPQQAAAKSSD